MRTRLRSGPNADADKAEARPATGHIQEIRTPFRVHGAQARRSVHKRSDLAGRDALRDRRPDSKGREGAAGCAAITAIQRIRVSRLPWQAPGGLIWLALRLQRWRLADGR